MMLRMMRVEYQTSFHLRSIKSQNVGNRRVVAVVVECGRNTMKKMENRFKSFEISLWKMRKLFFLLRFKLSCLNPKMGRVRGSWRGWKSRFHLIKTSSLDAFISLFSSFSHNIQHQQHENLLNYDLIDALYVTWKQFVTIILYVVATKRNSIRILWNLTAAISISIQFTYISISFFDLYYLMHLISIHYILQIQHRLSSTSTRHIKWDRCSPANAEGTSRIS